MALRPHPRRTTLRVGSRRGRALTRDVAQAIWLAIDADGSGFLCAKDFGAFMALGK